MNQIDRSSRPRNRSERRAQGGRGPAFCNVAGATWLVTCAVEEARKRGYMSRRDTQGMRQAEFNDYQELCRREWGVTDWEPEAS